MFKKNIKFIKNSISNNQFYVNIANTFNNKLNTIIKQFKEKYERGEINFEEIPAEIDCLDCDFQGEAILDDSDHYAPLVKCPKCDSLSVEILNGKDIVVKNIVIEKSDDT